MTTNHDNLPALPDRGDSYVGGIFYNADTLREYGQACYAAALEAKEAAQPDLLKGVPALWPQPQEGVTIEVSAPKVAPSETVDGPEFRDLLVDYANARQDGESYARDELAAVFRYINSWHAAGIAAATKDMEELQAELLRLKMSNAIAAARQAKPLGEEAMREAIGEGLRGLYGCQRVWSAWFVGTMGEDDFYRAWESDECVSQVFDAISAAILASQEKPE